MKKALKKQCQGLESSGDSASWFLTHLQFDQLSTHTQNLHLIFFLQVLQHGTDTMHDEKTLTVLNVSLNLKRYISASEEATQGKGLTVNILKCREESYNSVMLFT